MSNIGVEHFTDPEHDGHLRLRCLQSPKCKSTKSIRIGGWGGRVRPENLNGSCVCDSVAGGLEFDFRAGPALGVGV